MNDNVKGLEIGIATLRYDKMGDLEFAGFEPTMKFEVSRLLPGMELEQISGKAPRKKIVEQAENIFAAWFAKMDEIELADRTQYQVTSEVIKCLRWPTGLKPVKMIKVKFSFEKIKN
jgi:hypothetical protein